MDEEYLKHNNNIIRNVCRLTLVWFWSGSEPAQELYNHIREQTQNHLDSYAREGLRTLCIAKKVTLAFDRVMEGAVAQATASGWAGRRHVSGCGREVGLDCERIGVHGLYSV